MYKKMKLRNVPKAMIVTIPAFILWVCAYYSVIKENNIKWNKMITSMEKFETTEDDDVDESFVCVSDCD